jgi:hypothetical protein
VLRDDRDSLRQLLPPETRLERRATKSVSGPSLDLDASDLLPGDFLPDCGALPDIGTEYDLHLYICHEGPGAMYGDGDYHR